LSVHIESREGAERAFDATLGCNRRPADAPQLARSTARYPAATLRVLALSLRSCRQCSSSRASPSIGRPQAVESSVTNRAARAVVLRVLERITSGSLTVVEGRQVSTFRNAAPRTPRVVVRSPRAWRALLAASRGLAESYAVGLWESPDPPRSSASPRATSAASTRSAAGLTPIREPYQRARAAFVRNTPQAPAARTSPRTTTLGDALFTRMLDPTMTYSCALFEHPEMTLEEASLAKLRMVFDKRDLGPDGPPAGDRSGRGGAWRRWPRSSAAAA